MKQVLVGRGDRVNKGMVLARLADSTERAAIAVARHRSGMKGPELLAQAKEVSAKARFDRQKQMFDSEMASAQELDDALKELKEAEADLIVARENRALAALELAQQQVLLAQKTLISELDGVVTEQLAYVGEVVEPNDPNRPILRLAQLDPLRARAILPLEMLGKTTVGSVARVTLEEPLVATHEGKVVVIDPVVNPVSGTFGVYIDLPNPNGAIPAGVRCSATIFE